MGITNTEASNTPELDNYMTQQKQDKHTMDPGHLNILQQFRQSIKTL